MKKSHKSMPMFSIQCYEERQHTLRLRKPAEESTEHIENGQERLVSIKKHPPPPPPMPTTNGHHNGEINGGRTPKIEDIVKTPNVKKINPINRTPTPDYNDKVMLPTKTKSSNEVDVDSLESYKLQSSGNVNPRPPSNYFIKAPNGTATMKKHSRPVSVTIGEYVNNMNGRREPSKLEFLSGEPKSQKKFEEETLSSRLQSELALTLSRSNLRKKTETMVDGGR